MSETGSEIIAVSGVRLLLMKRINTLNNPSKRLQKTALLLSFQYRDPKTTGNSIKFKLANEKPKCNIFW